MWAEPDSTVHYLEEWEKTEADIRRRVQSERFTSVLSILESVHSIPRMCSSILSRRRVGSTTSRKSGAPNCLVRGLSATQAGTDAMKRKNTNSSYASCRCNCATSTMGQGKGPARRHRLRGPRRRRQGGHDPRPHRARQPARVPGRRAPGAVRPREVAGLHAALPAALSGCRRGGHLRSELVQPRRRRVRDGLLLAKGARTVPGVVSPDRAVPVEGGIILIKLWMEVSDDEQKRRFEARIERSGAAVEAQPDGSALAHALVRLLPRARQDAEEDRHSHRAVVHRPVGRQEDGAAEHHRASPVADPAQETDGRRSSCPGARRRVPYDDEASIARRRFVRERY